MIFKYTVVNNPQSFHHCRAVNLTHQSSRRRLLSVPSNKVQEIIGKEVEKGTNYTPDPSGLRTGNPPDEKMVEILNREVLALEEYVSKVNIEVNDCSK